MLIRVFIVSTVAAFCVGGGVLLAGYKDETPDVPPQWKLDYRGLSIAQIMDRLGPPQDDVSAKQFMNWVLPAADGIQLLKVICPQDCSGSEYPGVVLYLFYRDIDKEPTRAKDLLRNPSAITASMQRPGSARRSAGR